MYMRKDFSCCNIFYSKPKNEPEDKPSTKACHVLLVTQWLHTTSVCRSYITISKKIFGLTEFVRNGGVFLDLTFIQNDVRVPPKWQLHWDWCQTGQQSENVLYLFLQLAVSVFNYSLASSFFSFSDLFCFSLLLLISSSPSPWSCRDYVLATPN